LQALTCLSSRSGFVTAVARFVRQLHEGILTKFICLLGVLQRNNRFDIIMSSVSGAGVQAAFNTNVLSARFELGLNAGQSAPDPDKVISLDQAALQQEIAADLEDVRACLEGDEDAYANLIRRYENRIFGQMWRFSRNREVCTELVQDVFVEAYTSLHTFRGTAPFLHWLSRIATRTGYRFWKQQARQSKHVPLADWDGAADEADDHSDTDRSVRAADMVEKLLARLKPVDRLVLTLQYLEGCSLEEVASRTGWNVNVVKMRSFRARKRLREWIEQTSNPEDWSWMH